MNRNNTIKITASFNLTVKELVYLLWIHEKNTLADLIGEEDGLSLMEMSLHDTRVAVDAEIRKIRSAEMRRLRAVSCAQEDAP